MGDSIELPPGETVVGRDVTCALRFNDASVSRRHLRFIRRQHDVFVEDLGSSNGTLVNGERIAVPHQLNDGDEISIGTREVIVRVSDGDSSEPTTLIVPKLPKPVVKVDSMRAVTAEIPIARPQAVPAKQRCPHCGAPVTTEEDECVRCGYEWGTFRPMSRTDMKPKPVNRRRHDRQPIELHLVYASSELEIEAISRDLSESGVFVCTQVLDPVGTTCQLTILIDGGPPLALRGIVRRVNEREDRGEPIGLGIEFVSVGTADLAWIRSSVARAEAKA
jgi:hypothetical protein